MKKVLLGLVVIAGLALGSCGLVSAAPGDIGGGVGGTGGNGVGGGVGGTTDPGVGGGAGGTVDKPFDPNPGGSSTPISTSPCSSYVLTFPAWYNNLPCDTTTKAPTIQKLTDIWIIVLNIIEDIIQAMGYVTVGLIIWGGIKYIKSQGEPSQLSDAKSTILNALIGLGIILASVAIINFIVNSLAPAKGFGS